MKRMIQGVLTLLYILPVFTSCSDSDSLATPSESTQGKLVTLPQGVVSKGFTMQTVRIVNMTDREQAAYEKKNVQVAFDGQDVYVTGFSSSFPESFVKGTLTSAGTCLFKSGQYVGEDNTGEKYVVGIMGTGDKANQLTDFECTYDPEMRILTIPEDATFAVAESDAPSHTQVSNILQNVTVMPGSFKEPSVVTLPEGVTTEQWYITGRDNYDYCLNYGATIGFDGEDVYIQGLFKEMPLAWLHGHLKDGVITIEKGQSLGYYWKWRETLFLGLDEKDEICDIKLTYDAGKGTMESDYAISLYDIDKHSVDYGFAACHITKERYVVPDPILLPSGVTASPYRFEYEILDIDDDGYLIKAGDALEEVLIGFDGNDVYFKFPHVDANGWAKGTLSPDHQTITIPSLQYVGSWQEEDNPRQDYYLTGFVDKGNTEYELTDIVFDYDAQQDIISSSKTMCINSSYRILDYYGYLVFRNNKFTKKEEVAATPAAPEVKMDYNTVETIIRLSVEIPLVADDGSDLLTDKLSYIVYYEKDGGQHEMVFRATDYKGLENDIVEIPYNLNISSGIIRGGKTIMLDLALDGLLTWTKVGAKVIYRGGGEEHTSPITWFDAKSFYEENELIK